MSLLRWGLAAVAAMPIVQEGLRKPVSQRPVSDPESRFADLAQGRVHYRWHGPSEGPVALCIHGLTTPSYVWDGLIPYLVTKGFRVLSLDLYGRGLSARPRGLQDDAFYDRLLTDILQDQGITDPVTLFGNSMGSAISTAFAARHPARIRQVVLCVPAGMGHDLGLGAKVTQKLPVLGDWLFHLMYPRTLKQGSQAEAHLPTSVPDITRRQPEELRYRGFLRSVLSSLRGVLATPREADHRKLQGQGIPVLALWGGADDIIPIACKNRLSAWNPDATHIVIEDAGHGLIYTHTDTLWDQLEPRLLMD
ncbi:alpha/beta fold hydrolase [Shimia sediminis]|uniref:alpha/beta fold hydrolase n=1 Tax=Shimia sediminis TaxID=2497945 RepID=UPI000F8D51F3|nr:alpha/beta hydrolase [Shimia sediminis]